MTSVAWSRIMMNPMLCILHAASQERMVQALSPFAPVSQIKDSVSAMMTICVILTETVAMITVVF